MNILGRPINDSGLVPPRSHYANQLLSTFLVDFNTPYCTQRLRKRVAATSLPIEDLRDAAGITGFLELI